MATNDRTYIVAMGDSKTRMLRTYQHGPSCWRTMMTLEIAADQAKRWRKQIECEAGKPLPGCVIEVLQAAAGEWEDKDEPWLCQTHCYTDGHTATWAS